MKGPIVEVDAQRARWARYRDRERLVANARDEFASGGLGAFVNELDVRLLFLPPDPEAETASLDGEALGWLKQQRASPYGGNVPSWGHRERAVSDAVVLYDQYREDAGWERYLALHRHGGLEVGAGRLAYTVQETRVFRLRPIVGLAWTVAALQLEVAERWSLPAPYEFTVALRGTKGATLGHFAEGWAEVGAGFWDFATCIDDDVLLRWELEGSLDAEKLALNVGDRVEQAFGTTNRRHLAHRGEYEGRFDPRFVF